MTGIIIKALSGFYYIDDGSAVYECRARGNFRKSGISPLVGDKAEFELSGGSGVVTAVLPRKNFLSRPPVANIDRLFIVSSFENPAPNEYIIDRLTAIAVYHGIEPIIVFNKCDAGDFSRWESIYRAAGFRVFTVSAETGEGIDTLKSEFSGGISVLTGNSGVGKSSILNRIFGNTALKTGEVSEKLGRGRHTTRHTELFINPDGGYVADTPGFSSIEYDSGDYGFKEQLAECFPYFERFTGSCRFSTCSHTCENGCGVLKAVEDGLVEPTRHRSYVELFNELKQLKPWEAHNRKKK